MEIKRYTKFVESISGTELVGNHTGPGYPSQDNSPMKKIGMTDVIYSEIADKIVTYDEYSNLYNEYRKNLGQELLQEFTPENLDKVIKFLQQKDINIFENNHLVEQITHSGIILLNQSNTNETLEIQDIFQELVIDGDFRINIHTKAVDISSGSAVVRRNNHDNPYRLYLNYLRIEKDVLKTNELFFNFQEVKDEVCHFVSFLGERYYNCLIEKRGHDSKYGVDPLKYIGKDAGGMDSILCSVEVVYKEPTYEK